MFAQYHLWSLLDTVGIAAVSLKFPEVNSGPSRENRSETVCDLHERIRKKQYSIWLPLVFPSLQHDGVGRIRLLFPLQKERFSLAFSLCSPIYDSDTLAVKRHFPPISVPTYETVFQHCGDC